MDDVTAAAAPCAARDRQDGGPRPYHHGDLRAALLAAAEAELSEKGVEGFSLRSVARRAGVSHAAPAHHFGDADGLLTALAAVSFRRFAASMRAAGDAAGADPRARLAAMFTAYIAYAERQPAMFGLQFASARPDFSDPELSEAGEAAFDLLLRGVADARGADARGAGGGAAADDDPDRLREGAAAVWAAAHGMASLFSSRTAQMFAHLDEAGRAAAFARIARRIVDAA